MEYYDIDTLEEMTNTYINKMINTKEQEDKAPWENDKKEIQVVEDQLVLADSMKQKLIDLEQKKKEIDKATKEMKALLEEAMRNNSITGYESNDKRIKITLGEDTTSYDIDKDYLWEKYPDIYRECNTKETKRKGSLRITIREVTE